MLPRVLADLLVVGHLAFIVFVIAGGFLTWRWPHVVWAHIPCAVWGATVEFTGWICPLTPWEIALRRQAGQAGYDGGFIEHYLIPIIYPAGLTPTIQIGLGILVVTINVIAYAVYLRRRARR